MDTNQVGTALNEIIGDNDTTMYPKYPNYDDKRIEQRGYNKAKNEIRKAFEQWKKNNKKVETKEKK